MKTRDILLLAALIAATPAVAKAQAAGDAPAGDAATIATTLLDHLDAHDYAAAEAMFGEGMAAAVPADPAGAAASPGRSPARRRGG